MKEEIAIPKRGLVSGGTRFGSWGPSPTCAGIGRESLGLESSSTTPICHRDIANSTALSPMRFWILGSTSSRSNSNFTTPSCSLSVVHESGVRSCKASIALGSLSSCPSTNFIAPSSLFAEAQEINVRSEEVSVVLGLISARLKNNFATLL